MFARTPLPPASFLRSCDAAAKAGGGELTACLSGPPQRAATLPAAPNKAHAAQSPPKLALPLFTPQGMRVLLLGLLVCLAASAAEASTWPWRMARRMAELPVSKPTPECAALSDADFQSSWQLLDEKCPKSAPFLCATTSDCWRALEALGYKCAKAAARAAANGTDDDAAVDRM